MTFIDIPAPTSLSDPIRLLFGSGSIPTTRFTGTPTVLEFFQFMKDYGFSTKNRFFVTFNVPVLRNSLWNEKRMSMFCKSSSFPSSKIDTAELEVIPSMKEKIAMNYNFSEGASLQLSFYCSSSLFERRFFEVWQSAVVNPRNQYVNYYDEYAKPNQISVIKLPRGSASFEDTSNWTLKKSERVKMEGRSPDPQTTSGQDGIFYGVTYYECYPTNISTIELGWSSGSEIMEVTVDIAYKYYTTPVTVNFENYENNSESPLEGEYMKILGFSMQQGNVSTGEGIVGNKMDKWAKAINGVVVPATNVVNRINQIF